MDGVLDDASAGLFIVPVTCVALSSVETSEASWYEQPETAITDSMSAAMAANGLINAGRAGQSNRHRRNAKVPLYK